MTLSATLQHGLERYAIGTRVRALRLKKKIGLVELGRHTGLSPALLSKIERGRLFPTLPTLLRIALVFGVDLHYFVNGPREKPVLAVVRRKDRVSLPERPGRGAISYVFASLDFAATERKFSAYFAEFRRIQADAVRPHEHAGVEFIYVMRGTLQVQVRPDEHLLPAGDSMYFDSTVPHSYRRVGVGACSAIVVTAG
jgi:transcriptional regulator with XRE-family HTH domain